MTTRFNDNAENQPETPVSAGSLQGVRILLVEDSPDQQRLYGTFLRHAGAEVTLECSGDAAVDTVDRSADAFDAIVMDLEMPGMDGIEATRQLRSRGFPGAIIAMTANGSPRTQRRWFDAGCDAYLEKPVPKQALVAIVRDHSMIANKSVPT